MGVMLRDGCALTFEHGADNRSHQHSSGSWEAGIEHNHIRSSVLEICTRLNLANQITAAAISSKE